MLSDLRFRLRAIFGRSAREQELADELRFHLERETDKLIAAGVPEAEASRRARVAFGGVERIKDDTRDARGIQLIDSIAQDLRYAWRGLRARPGFTAAVVLALALGIGANATMFGVVDRLMFRPPAYIVDPGRVHRVYLTFNSPDGKMTVSGGTNASTEHILEYRRYLDLTEWTTSFDRTAAVTYRTIPVGDGDQTREMTVAAISASTFDFFDARPEFGRFFTASEDRAPTGASVAVLGYAYWLAHYGGRRDVIGQTVHVGTGMLTIIGVAPRGFAGMEDDRMPVMFVPISTVGGWRGPKFHLNYNVSWLEMFVRARPGISQATMDADLTTAYRRSWEAERAMSPLPTLTAANPRATAGPLLFGQGPQASPQAKVATWIMGVAMIVLLIACANVANLMLTKAVVRRREIALRLALGVSRARLIQQLITESLLLAALGGLAGLAVAVWGGALLRKTFLPEAADAAVFADSRTLAFVAVVTLGVALLTGVAPALHSLREDVSDALKSGSRGAGRGRSRLRTGLLLFQGALSVVLLVGAGLFTRSLMNVRTAHMGYDIDPLLYIEGNLRGAHLTTAEQNALSQRMLDAVSSMPEVSSATLALSVPFYSSEGRGAPRVPGRDSLQRLGSFLTQAGSPSYFATMGTRIIQGRGFLETDRAGTQRVAVISETMAHAVWPNETAIGKVFRLGSDTSEFITVVGVAESMRGRDIRDANEIWYYLPIAQQDETYPSIFARMKGRPEESIDAIRRRLQPLLPGAAYVNVMPLRTLVGVQQQAWSVGASMFLAFGGLALLLAAIGLYSVIAYAVAQRTREFGVRLALGASGASVVRMIVGEGVAFAIAGIVIGSAIALAAGKWIEPVLFAQSPRDPLVFVAAASVLLLVAVVAVVRPAIRATRVDPNEVLRAE